MSRTNGKSNATSRVEMAENWIQIDEAEDVAGSLRHAIRCSQFLASDPLTWKWVSLALHSAFQGACVCHLTTTAIPVGAVTRRNAAEWLAYFEHRRSDPNAQRPRTQLMALPDLLKEIRKPRSSGDRSNQEGIDLADDELDWLCRFHETVRNQFVHFEPKGWSIEVSGIGGIALLVARIISDISDAGWAFRQKDRAWRTALQCDLTLLSVSDCLRN